jgi:hypothetical protein
MPLSIRALFGTVGLTTLLAAGGCGDWVFAPTDSRATVSGTVNPGSSSLTYTAAATAGRTGATAPADGWTVTVAGSGVTTSVDAFGNFEISGVPTGVVELVFRNGDVTATITLSSVKPGELIQILVAITGGTATVVNETRSTHQIELCHRSDDGYHLLRVSASAEPAHRGHGDAAVGEDVPADPTKIFSRSCRLVPKGVSLVKSTNGEDANQAPGPFISVGSPITWRYVVTNTSTAALTNIVVADDQNVAVSCGQTTLDAGQSMTCTGSGVAVAGQYRNVGTVTATANTGPVNDSDPSHYFGVVPTPDEGAKVRLCHRTGNGSYHLIEVSQSAVPAHLGHGDGYPGQGTFTASCGLR